jgi:hypothetical protein
MSRATVRQAIATYLTNANVTNLSSVRQFPAKLTPEGEFFEGEDPGHSSGAIIFLYIESQHENRIALGGPHNGRKAIDYTFILDCYLRSTHQKSEDAGFDNETFLDSLVTAIRADRNAGAPGTVFQWGEGANGAAGGQDIDITSYYPKQINGKSAATQVTSVVRVHVVEIIDN